MIFFVFIYSSKYLSKEKDLYIYIHIKGSNPTKLFMQAVKENKWIIHSEEMTTTAATQQISIHA